MDEELIKYREELIELLHKSQDAFEKQLSYISTGSLALSIGFIKDIIPNIHRAFCKGLLFAGWSLLAVTLLINCISHIRAASLHNKTISEIHDKTINQTVVKNRYKEVILTNWATVITLSLGIFLVVIFIILNTYKNV